MGFRSIAGMMLVALAATACGAGDDDAKVGAQSSSLRGIRISMVSGSVSQGVLTAGQLQTATATIRSATSVSNLIVDLRIYDWNDHQVSKQTFDSVAIAAGDTATLRFDYASPSTLPAGEYHVAVGVWDPSWRTYLYDTSTTFFVVGAGSSCSHPDWIEYQSYAAGSIVTYQGNLYIAKYANPGYIPTVSTYYWAPYGCDGSAPSSASVPPPADTGSAPPPAPPASSTNLPAKIVGGYFTTWDARSGMSLRSVVDNTSYNLIYVAFATGVTASSGTLQLEVPPGASSPSDFKSQAAYANSKGRTVIVSVGGYYDLPNRTSGYRLDSTAKVDQFMASMRDLRNNWGFNGMDWDLEHGERPDVAGIVDASRRMKSEFGSSFVVAAAPGVNLSTWVGAGGILDTLGASGWDLVGEQVYDWGVPESTYQSMIVDRMSVLSNKYGASKVVLGNKYKTDEAYRSDLSDPSNTCVDIATTKAALSTLRSRGVNIRGAFVWNVQSDADASYQWQGANGVGGDILRHP